MYSFCVEERGSIRTLIPEEVRVEGELRKYSERVRV